MHSHIIFSGSASSMNAPNLDVLKKKTAGYEEDRLLEMVARERNEFLPAVIELAERGLRHRRNAGILTPQPNPELPMKSWSLPPRHCPLLHL